MPELGNIKETIDNENVDVETNEDVADDKAVEDKTENALYGAPENYDFKGIELPEGIKFDENLATKFDPIAKELNLSQEGANKLVNMLIEHQQGQLQNANEQIAEYERQKQEAQVIEYSKMLNSDKEIGTDDETRNAYIDIADRGYKAFASKELQKTIESQGLNYHPAFIKFFHRLGKLCGEDKITKTATPVQQKQTPAEILYGNNQKE